MVFEIKGKVALITGGVSGIGLESAKELLRNLIRGVAVADVNVKLGKTAIEDIENEFGPGRAIFIETDVTDKKSFEEAFEKTIKEFGNIDILLNNAGMLNDALWEKEIQINLNGVIHGMLLGLDKYIPKYKSDFEGVIVNTCSIGGISESPSFPVYSATKFAVLGLSVSWGHNYHYKRTNVRVLAVCPGVTNTSLFRDLDGKYLQSDYEEYLEMEKADLVEQEPRSVALGVMKMIKNAKSGTVWVVEGGEDPYEYLLPKFREEFAPKC